MAATESSEKPRLQYVRGLALANEDWFKKENVEAAMDYVPRDGDIIIASYPKTGTTWMQYIVLQILSFGEFFPPFDDVNSKLVPFLEMTGTNAVEVLTPPRVYKHHLPYDTVQKNSKAKVIYTYRNPEDTVASFYHFLTNLGSERDQTVDSFFRNFLVGEVSFGNYFNHVKSYYDRRSDPNLLMVSYEKLLANRREEILRVAKFIDEKYSLFLEKHEEILEKIIKQTNFDYMKKNLSLSFPVVTEEQKRDVEGQRDKKVNFFRKGTSGDGKTFLNEEHRKLVRDAVEKLFKGTDIEKEWLGDRR